MKSACNSGWKGRVSISITVPLSEQAKELFRRPVTGEGGFQSLLRKLQQQVSPDGLVLYLADVEQVARYAREYGSGGFQQRLGPLIEEIRTVLAALSDALQEF